MNFISYAQNLEDVYINRCFHNINNGFFLDVGASSPVVDNLTYAFYLKGWRGINIEPIPERYNELKRIRPNDININCVLGKEIGETILFRTPGIGGMSTLNENLSKSFNIDSKQLVNLPVKSNTLKNICELFVKNKSFEFLKIDVEGAEKLVLEGGDFLKWRPQLIIIESISSVTKNHTYQEWENILLDASYKPVFDDNLNKYYLRIESLHLEYAFKKTIDKTDNVLRFSEFENPLDNANHPDHFWAKTFSSLVCKTISIESDDWLISLFTSDYSPQILNAPPKESDIESTFWRILARKPSNVEIIKWQSIYNAKSSSLKDLIIAVATSNEFKMKRGRCSI